MSLAVAQPLWRQLGFDLQDMAGASLGQRDDDAIWNDRNAADDDISHCTAKCRSWPCLTVADTRPPQSLPGDKLPTNSQLEFFSA